MKGVPNLGFLLYIIRIYYSNNFIFSGTCRVCKEKLKPAVASKERLRRLERNMMILIESSIARKINSRITDVKLLKTNINIKNKIENQSKYYELFDIVSMETRGHSKEGDDDRLPVVNPEHAEIAHKLSPWVFAKLRDLREYIDSHGPFDVVIDVLNTGYFTKGFNPLQVRGTSKHSIFRDVQEKLSKIFVS